ncbi:MAG: lipocalin-like domain-containing protein [Lentimicrobiaceae bacterium]|nr:lipocalin-like domain-containing protein [Lentimicrobiaceae bacterium]
MIITFILSLLQWTSEEIITAYNGFLAYYGTYQILTDSNLIIHNIKACSFPNWVGQNQQNEIRISYFYPAKLYET